MTQINAQRYIDITFVTRSGAAIDDSSINGDEFTLSGAITADLIMLPGTGGIPDIVGTPLKIGPNTYRYYLREGYGAYFGLRPKKQQSGAHDPELRISKTGDPFVRRMLVQAAQYILGHYGPDTALRRFGERLVARGGRAARKKAAVAVARKLAVLLHRLWVTGERYERLRGVTLAAVA